MADRNYNVTLNHEIGDRTRQDIINFGNEVAEGIIGGVVL